MSDAQPRLVYARGVDGRYVTRQKLARAVHRGSEVRVARGAYLPTADWTPLEPRDRYLLRVRAIAETRRHRVILSHWSAAAVHNLPMIGPWPNEIHTIVGPTAGGRSRNGVIKHSLRLADSDVQEIDGLLVTTIERTVLDMAVAGTFMTAVTMADHALHVDRYRGTPPRATKDGLRAVWEQTLPFNGHVRALEVIEFAESLADTPIESVSRVSMRVIGCPRPLLQTRFYDPLGFIGETDFDWPDFAQLGEADGDRKYLDPAYRGGRTADEVLRDEKVREDRLRALRRGVSRWRWKVAVNPSALRRLLVAAGLPMGVPWKRGPAAG